MEMVTYFFHIFKLWMSYIYPSLSTDPDVTFSSSGSSVFEALVQPRRMTLDLTSIYTIFVILGTGSFQTLRN